MEEEGIIEEPVNVLTSETETKPKNRRHKFNRDDIEKAKQTKEIKSVRNDLERIKAKAEKYDKIEYLKKLIEKEGLIKEEEVKVEPKQEEAKVEPIQVKEKKKKIIYQEESEESEEEVIVKIPKQRLKSEPTIRNVIKNNEDIYKQQMMTEYKQRLINNLFNY